MAIESKPIYYFAYGSNMDHIQMKHRCPTAHALGKHKLDNFKLDFTFNSKSWGGGVADVVKELGNHVYGVVFQLTKQDLDNLDRYEGYYGRGQANAYDRKITTITFNGEKIRVYVYVVRVKSKRKLLPSQAYMEGIIRGARKNKLPAAYIRKLEQIETID